MLKSSYKVIDACELGFQHVSDTDIVNAAAKQKGEEEGGEDESEEEEKVVSALVTSWHYSVLTLLDCVGQRGFRYSDITATRKICTVMTRSLNCAQKQVTIINYFSNKHQFWK
jgi:hypothetical protein